MMQLGLRQDLPKVSVRQRKLSDVFLERGLSYICVAAVTALLFFFLILPVMVIVSRAFLIDGRISFDYFFLLAENQLYRESIANSFGIAVLTTLAATAIALPLAIINSRLDFPGQKALSALLLVPMIMPPFVGAIGIQRFFASYGSFNLLLLDLGVISEPINWLSGDYVFYLVVLLECLHLYPIMYLNLVATLSNIDPSLDEAASSLGAGPFRKFWDITWPLARPGLIAGGTIVFIWAFTDLGTPLLVGYSACLSVNIFNLVTSVDENQIGYAMVFMVILLSVAAFMLSKRAIPAKRYQMLARGHVSSLRRNASKWMLLLIYPLFIGLTAFALIPHFAVLLTSFSDQWFMTILPEQWTLSHYRNLWHDNLASTGIKNSVFLATLATAVDLVLGLVIGFVVSRKNFPLAGFLDALVMIPLALPGIVLAFGYVITYSNTFLDPLVDPVFLLIVAYSIRRLPFMVRSAAAGFSQTSQSLEEASYTLGASKLRTLVKISMPLVSANLIAGALLCFSYAMLDVSDSLILAMKDRFYPLTKAIYALYLEQGSGEFLASALGGISMALLAFCIITASLLLGKKMGELFRA